jgi:ABC-type nitrate/sulfonate/bicarbonate transport system permease component
VFFVVFLSTLAGVATVPPQLVSVVRVMGAAPLAVFRKVVLPSALPFIVTALRLTIPAALIGAIIGTAKDGKGFELWYRVNDGLLPASRWLRCSQPSAPPP